MAKSKGSVVTLREKPLANGKVSLFLDINIPREKRVKEYLKIHIKKKVSTSEERSEKNELLKLAQKIRAKRESQLLHEEYGYKDPNLKKVNLIQYFDSYISKYQHRDIRMMKSAQRVFKDYVGKDILKPNELTEKVVTGFKEYLIDNFNGETPSSYFQRFKKFLNILVKEGILVESPAKGVSITIPKNDIGKDILLENEIVKLASVRYKNENKAIRQAFLFALYTGIDFKTTISLKLENIIDNQLKTTRSKVKNTSQYSVLMIPLNRTCRNIIEAKKGEKGTIFNLPSHTTCLKHLDNWVKAAEIEKHITWHCARHSFITNLLINKEDLGSVMSLSGHSSLEHLQKYIHYVDERKKKAVDKFPELTID